MSIHWPFNTKEAVHQALLLQQFHMARPLGPNAKTAQLLTLLEVYSANFYLVGSKSMSISLILYHKLCVEDLISCPNLSLG